jgi:hypothetical protein
LKIAFLPRTKAEVIYCNNYEEYDCDGKGKDSEWVVDRLITFVVDMDGREGDRQLHVER